MTHTATDIHTEHSRDYILTAGESNAQGIMPLTLMVERVIESATRHANELGIGYDALIKHNIGWVLSRLTLEMSRFPRINEHYCLTTWIESTNKFFSLRNFAITAPGGEVLGYARTVWVAIDYATRRMAPLSKFDMSLFPTAPLECPIAPTPQMKALEGDCETSFYRFKYCDLDFNRHVNTVRYIEVLMNQWSLEHYDRYFPSRFDIIFHHECYYDEEIELRRRREDGTMTDMCEMVAAPDKRAISAAFTWKELEK
ncbi:MAG: acyl-[acyl-carrier-protein] thioesterase [Muribaculaceae bacterium]|nr:acyl-[acyl-carrier-protein] thioesterase [Muribaculaceae bacterium]